MCSIKGEQYKVSSSGLECWRVHGNVALGDKFIADGSVYEVTEIASHYNERFKSALVMADWVKDHQESGKKDLINSLGKTRGKTLAYMLQQIRLLERWQERGKTGTDFDRECEALQKCFYSCDLPERVRDLLRQKTENFLTLRDAGREKPEELPF